MHCILFFLVVCEIILYYSAHLSICQTIPGGSNNEMQQMEIEKKKSRTKRIFFLDGQITSKMEEAEGWKAWMEGQKAGWAHQALGQAQ